MASKRVQLHSIVLYLVFGVYLLILVVLLFFKASAFQSVNLVPFRSIVEYVTEGGAFAVGNVLGNIALFVPLGVYLSMFLRKTTVFLPTAGVVLVSVAAEVLQYMMRVGAADIDDVILNGFGGCLGVFVFQALFQIWKEKTRYVVSILSLVVGIAFISLMICLYYGVFGVVIR